MTAKDQARHHLPILAFGLLSAAFIVGLGLLALAVWMAISAAPIATLVALTGASLVAARPLRPLVALAVPAGLAAIISYWWLSGDTDASSCPWYGPPAVVDTPIPTATSGATSPSTTPQMPVDGTKPPTTMAPGDPTTTSRP